MTNTPSQLGIVAFIISAIVPFIFLDWKWSIFLVFYNTVISTMLGMILWAPFAKYLRSRSESLNGFVTGLCEGVGALIAILILDKYFVSFETTNFILVLIFVYSINQIARSVSAKGTEHYDYEDKQIYGYVLVFLIFKILF